MTAFLLLKCSKTGRFIHCNSAVYPKVNYFFYKKSRTFKGELDYYALGKEYLTVMFANDNEIVGCFYYSQAGLVH